eukprot:763940-Hanusia_phi.AAC.16
MFDSVVEGRKRGEGRGGERIGNVREGGEERRREEGRVLAVPHSCSSLHHMQHKDSEAHHFSRRCLFALPSRSLDTEVNGCHGRRRIIVLHSCPCDRSKRVRSRGDEGSEVKGRVVVVSYPTSRYLGQFLLDAIQVHNARKEEVDIVCAGTFGSRAGGIPTNVTGIHMDMQVGRIKASRDEGCLKGGAGAAAGVGQEM